jgi:putative nucleotidyltransferase with HDIG domain
MSYLAKRDPLERFLRDLSKLLQVNRIYPAGHDQIASAAKIASESLSEWGHPVRISLMGEDLMVEDRSVTASSGSLKALTTVFKDSGWEGARIDPECEPADLVSWLIHASGGSGGGYSSGGVVAGAPEVGIEAEEEATEDEWERGSSDDATNANRAIEELERLKPKGLARAREIVRSLVSRLSAGEDLLSPVRRLKEFDDYSFTHALNVTIVSMSIARKLGLPNELVEAIALGALCHDVGKAKVPEEILNKPGQLTPEERQVINNHPREGSRILLALPQRVHPLLPTIAYEHHVHLDGSGYPDLQGGLRPHPASLLVEVADVFDALRTIRPYRGALSEAQAITIMLKDVDGGQLHRGYIAALVSLVELLSPDRPIKLADGRSAVVIANDGSDALAPLVETEEGEILDLSDPTMPQIAKVEERWV